MAVYATQDDVLARAGRFGGAFSVAGKRPNLADLDAMLAAVSATIDVEIRTHGFDPATLTADIKEALVDVAAWAVLIRALPEALPGDNAIDGTVERGRQIVSSAGFPALAEGMTNLLTAVGVIADLEAGQGGSIGAGAGSFWDELPSDWLQLNRTSHRDDVTIVNGAFPDDAWLDADAAAPQFRRGQAC